MGKSSQKSQAEAEPPPSEDAYDIVFYVHDDESMPAEDFLDSCPDSVQDDFAAILIAVATSPPHKFAGGGMWEAMHGDMRGWYEARKDFQRRHYRLFCLLDTKARSRAKPLLVVVDGREIDATDYKKIRAPEERYRKTPPPPIA